MLSEHILRTGIKPAPYQTSFELVIGTESRVVNFQAVWQKQINIIAFTIAVILN